MIKIALTNLGKYNEGELVYTWLTLPASDEEIAKAFEDIGVADNTEYEEHFISDWEAPTGVEVGEYSSIESLNELAEALDKIDGIGNIFEGTYDAGDVINLAQELESHGIISDAYDYIEGIVSDDRLDEMVKERAEGGWQSVACFLAGIDYMNDEYYHINGYANAENLTHGMLEAIVSDLMSAVSESI